MTAVTSVMRPDLKAVGAPVDVGSVAPRRAPDIGASSFEDSLAGALDHSAAACHWIYDTYAGRVFGYLRAQGAFEPEDLTSEVFLRVFDRLGQFTGDEVQFRSWLFTIAHRILIDEARRRKSRPETTELVAGGETFLAGDVEHEALTNVGTAWADELVASLPPDQRAVVALRVTADLPINEVARILGKRAGAVKALQHRAFASLRKRCEEVIT
jgi:RNA polymerase sigma-70 factor (ECF subfamily)